MARGCTVGCYIHIYANLDTHTFRYSSCKSGTWARRRIGKPDRTVLCFVQTLKSTYCSWRWMCCEEFNDELQCWVVSQCSLCCCFSYPKTSAMWCIRRWAASTYRRASWCLFILGYTLRRRRGREEALEKILDQDHRYLFIYILLICF